MGGGAALLWSFRNPLYHLHLHPHSCSFFPTVHLLGASPLSPILHTGAICRELSRAGRAGHSRVHSGNGESAVHCGPWAKSSLAKLVSVQLQSSECVFHFQGLKKQTKNTGQRQMGPAKPKISTIWPVRENICRPPDWHHSGVLWPVDGSAHYILGSSNGLLFWKLILVSWSVLDGITASRRGDFRTRKLKIFRRVQTKGKKCQVKYVSTVVFSPSLITGKPAGVDTLRPTTCWPCLPLKEPGGGTKTLLSYSKMIHFLFSPFADWMLARQEQSEWFGVATLGKKDVF